MVICLAFTRTAGTCVSELSQPSHLCQPSFQGKWNQRSAGVTENTEIIHNTLHQCYYSFIIHNSQNTREPRLQYVPMLHEDINARVYFWL